MENFKIQHGVDIRARAGRPSVLLVKNEDQTGETPGIPKEKVDEICRTLTYEIQQIFIAFSANKLIPTKPEEIKYLAQICVKHGLPGALNFLAKKCLELHDDKRHSVFPFKRCHFSGPKCWPTISQFITN